MCGIYELLENASENLNSFACTLNKQGERELDEILAILEKNTKRTQSILDESKSLTSKHIESYDRILKSRETTEAQKVRALLGKTLEHERLERLSSQLILLYILQIFAFKAKVLKISIDNIDEQLKSGILEKTKEIEDIKKNVDKLRILLEAQYKSIRKISKNRGKDFYVS